MKKNLVLLSLLVVFGFGGCASTQHTIRVSDNIPMNGNINYDDVDYEQVNHFFLGGLLQNSNSDLTNVCPHGQRPAKIINETRWYQSLIGIMTAGLYTPRMTYVICR